MSQIVTANSRVLSQLAATLTVVNNNCSFRLFSNDATLTPATTLANLVECTFAGYTRINTTGKFPTPFKVREGQYESDSTAFEYTPTDDSNEFIFGWSISKLTALHYAAKFDEPLPVVNGQLLSIIVALQEASLSLCSC